MYCSHWNLAAVLYGWKAGLVWLLCVSAGCISGVLGVRFSGTLSVSVGGSGFCVTEKTWCRNVRVGSNSHHHVDRCCQGEWSVEAKGVVQGVICYCLHLPYMYSSVYLWSKSNYNNLHCHTRWMPCW